jgi:metallo-beta-lactamase class B
MRGFLSLSAQEPLRTTVVASTAEITIRKLDGEIYLIEDRHFLATNYVFYVGSRFVTLVGAMWTPDVAAQVKDLISKVTSKPIKEIVNVDYNPEYSGGNQFWRANGIDVISTELTAKLQREQWESICNFIRKYVPDYPTVMQVSSNTTFPGSFDLQYHNLRVFFLGGSHTPDDVFVYFPQEKILYAGSILKDQLGNMAFSNVEEYRKTLQKLRNLDLPIRMIISGHYSAIHDSSLIERFLEMLNGYKNN